MYKENNIWRDDQKFECKTMQKESFYAFYILLFGRMNKIRIFAKSNHDYSNDHYYFLVMRFFDMYLSNYRKQSDIALGNKNTFF